MVSKALITRGANLRQIMAQAPPDYWPELSSTINTDGSINNGSGGGSYLALDGSTTMTGDIVLTESADHGSTPSAGYGYLWVKSDSPNSLYFTADDGTDYDLTASASSDYVDTATYKVTVGTTTLSGSPIPTHQPHTAATLSSLFFACTKSIAASGVNYLDITARNQPDGSVMQSTVSDTQSGYTANAWVDLGIDQNNSFDGSTDSIEVTITETGTVTSLNGHNLLFRAVYS